MAMMNAWNSVARRRLLKTAAFGSLAAFIPLRFGNAQSAPSSQHDLLKAMPNEITADEMRALLRLDPHPTCGFVRETYRSPDRIAPGGLPAPFADGRPLGSALYFMVTPERHVHLHRIRNDQLYHYYLGDPLELLMLRTDGTSEKVVVGPDLRNGQHVQLLIPGNTFHTARIVGARRWFLGASTEWPGVEPSDVELGNLEVLASKYPQAAAELRAIASNRT